jgi:hypothetical protein
MKKRIVIEVEEDLKSLAEAFEELLDRVRTAKANDRGGRSVSYEEIERAFGEETAKLERAAHAATLAELDVDTARVSIRGKSFYRIGRAEGTYYTLAGEVRVERCLYRESGVRNGKTVDPIAVRVGAIGNGWLPEAARGMAHLLQQGTAREAEETGKKLRRLTYSASSFERVGHQVGRLYQEERADIEDDLIENFELPEGAASISVSLDRVSIPMEELLKRPRGRPRKNAPKRLIARQYRMAWCGVLTVHDKDGEGLRAIRYGAMPGDDVEAFCCRMATDALKLVEKNKDLKLVRLADGAPDLWKLLEAHFPDEVFGKSRSLVDFWHLIEKLSAAAKVLDGDEPSWATVARWKHRLARKPGAVDKILAELRASGKDQVRVGESKPVHEAITYMTNHRDRMDYAAARKAGLAIGSGYVEATCKSLFAIRMKRPGSRWQQESGGNIVQLRALALSDRWDAAMDKFAATQRTAVRQVA